MQNVAKQIEHKLTSIERERDLRIVFACESGSRAWGFASTDSDYDVRFVYVRPVRAYLRLSPPVDAFDLPLDGELDFAGWDIRKTAGLLKKSNPPLLEWLQSPIMYRADADVLTALRQLADDYFCPKKTIYHYLSMASNVWRTHLAERESVSMKKYLYALRPLAAIRFIDQHGAQPATRFDDVLDAIDWSNDVITALGELLDRKRAAEELGQCPPIATLHHHIESELAAAEDVARRMPPTQRTNQALDDFVASQIL